MVPPPPFVSWFRQALPCLRHRGTDRGSEPHSAVIAEGEGVLDPNIIIGPKYHTTAKTAGLSMYSLYGLGLQPVVTLKMRTDTSHILQLTSIFAIFVSLLPEQASIHPQGAEFPSPHPLGAIKACSLHLNK
jgi:hypothetical protein